MISRLCCCATCSLCIKSLSKLICSNAEDKQSPNPPLTFSSVGLRVSYSSAVSNICQHGHTVSCSLYRHCLRLECPSLSSGLFYLTECPLSWPGPFLSSKSIIFLQSSLFVCLRREEEETPKIYGSFGTLTQGKMSGTLRIPIFGTTTRQIWICRRNKLRE